MTFYDCECRGHMAIVLLASLEDREKFFVIHRALFPFPFYPEMAVRTSSFFRIVILMIIFGRPECEGFPDFCNNVKPMFPEYVNQFLGGFLLFFVFVKDGGMVLSSDIGALAVRLCWIMDLEKELCQFMIGDTARIKNYFQGFEMTGGAGTHLFVGWVGDIPPHISDSGG